MDRTEVLVVGAGPTGLALACDLLVRGIDTTVVEQRDEPATTSRAFALHARGLEILEDVGAGDIVHRTTPVTGVTMHAAGHPLARLRLGGLARFGHPGAYLVSQADVEAALRDRLAELGGAVRFGHRFAKATDHGHGVAATIETGHDDTVELHADWLVGCDGARSTVREVAGIAFEGGTLPETFLLADLQLEGPRIEHEISAFLHEDGVLGLFPLPEPGVWRLVAQAGDTDDLPDDADHVAATLQELVRRRADRDDIRVAAATWWSRFRIHRRLATRYRAGRFLLAGDAAHEHSPFGGQGMNVGLGDAGNLGWKLAALARGRAGRRLLDSYEQERRPVAEQVVDRTTSTTRFATGDHAAGRVVRDLVLPLLARARSDRPSASISPPLALLERFAQLGVRYRSGPLASQPSGVAAAVAAARHGPRAGDRAPDGPVIVLPAGTRTSLHTLTRAGWALLQLGPPSSEQAHAAEVARQHLGDDLAVVRVLSSAASVAPVRWSGALNGDAHVLVEDHRGIVHRTYRPRGSASVLVRPDGHVGWRSGRPSPPLARWLGHVLERG